ncbi:MAG: hypothetical protein AB9917_24140 [Negativicutes bacterium]
MNESRQIKLDKKYVPLPVRDGDEIYPNGIFNFGITRMLEDICSGRLDVEKEQINVQEWFKTHCHSSVNEEHLPTVDVSNPVIQAEIRPGTFEIIDGNHRMERARRDGIKLINSYKMRGEQLVPYFSDLRGYKAFVEYWNSKLRML